MACSTRVVADAAPAQLRLHHLAALASANRESWLTPTSIIAMMAHPITLIPGDGIGPEVADATVRAVDATGVAIEWERVEAGARALAEYGQLIPDEVFASLEVNARGPERSHRHSHRRRPPEHQRGAAQEAGAVRELPSGAHAARPEDALPRSAARPGHLPRKHRRPVLRSGARSGAGRGREPEDHHPKGLHADRPRRLRIRAPRKPPQGHRHPQGQYHEA